MEVLNNSSALLSNCEVLLLLSEIQETKQKLKSNKSLATISYESIKYLEDNHCHQINKQLIHQFLIAVKDKFRLTKAEKLQILNQRPNTLVELQLLIEENEERFSEEAMDQLLEVIKNTLNADTDDGEQEMTEDNNESNSEPNSD